MLNFTVGPVQAGEQVLSVGSEQVPYFRTPEFSRIMLENESMVKELAGAEEGARAVFLTGSGTASMEAAVMGVFTENDRVLVVNGGSFGHRFVELCEIHKIPFTEIKLEYGCPLTEDILKGYEGSGYTGFLVNAGETSTGVLYDMEMIGEFCRRNQIFLVVDAISSFLADPFDMKAVGAGIMLTGSQKALACPPGISIVVLSKEGIRRVEASETKCMYLNLKDALKNGERGQTPFTPAVGILRQIHVRLKQILEQGGVQSENARIAGIAEDFRSKIRELPLKPFTSSPSNAVTSLCPLKGSAQKIFTVLKDEYGIWVCPNGGELADRVFRVGHIGALTEEDNTTLVRALKELEKRGLL